MLTGLRLEQSAGSKNYNVAVNANVEKLVTLALLKGAEPSPGLLRF